MAMSSNDIRREGKRLGAVAVVIFDGLGEIFFYDTQTAKEFAGSLAQGDQPLDVKCYTLKEKEETAV